VATDPLPGTRAAGPALVSVAGPQELQAALAGLGLSVGRPVLVSVGGAAGMAAEHVQAVRLLLSDHLVPALTRLGAAVVDGGTHSGVMQIMGEVLAGSDPGATLVGVAASGTVRVPGSRSDDTHRAELDPHHRAVILVPGNQWGDESSWIARVATALCAGGPSATLVVNGGEITYADLRHSVEARRPVLVIEGTGRTADQLARALHGRDADPRAVGLARSGLLRVAAVDDGDAAARILARLLGSGEPAARSWSLGR
jgi:hypothetical protein